MGGEKWAVNRHEEATLDQFSVASIVLLSPDAKQPLEAPLDPVKVYVVGGLVDRSPRKGITAKVWCYGFDGCQYFCTQWRATGRMQSSLLVSC